MAAPPEDDHVRLRPLRDQQVSVLNKCDGCGKTAAFDRVRANWIRLQPYTDDGQLDNKWTGHACCWQCLVTIALDGGADIGLDRVNSETA